MSKKLVYKKNPDEEEVPQLNLHNIHEAGIRKKLTPEEDAYNAAQKLADEVRRDQSAVAYNLGMLPRTTWCLFERRSSKQSYKQFT